MLELRTATGTDLNPILGIHQAAFGDRTGGAVARLVRLMLDDPTAQPQISLIAAQNGLKAGHALFNKARIEGSTTTVSARLLAVLAVAPMAQSQGVGGHLIDEGLYRLTEDMVEIVFALGHPGYLGRHGFVAAEPLGFDTPASIPIEPANAWMVRALGHNRLNDYAGRLRCCATLHDAARWTE